MEKLVDDIETTTSSYKQIQDREARLAADLTLAQTQLFPLRKENTRLARENHQLHVDSIKQKDNMALALDEHKRMIKDLEAKLIETKHVADMKEKQLYMIEKERDKLRDAYEKVLDPSRKKKDKPGKGNIQISSPLSPNPFLFVSSSPVRGGHAHELDTENVDPSSSSSSSSAPVATVTDAMNKALADAELRAQEQAKLDGELISSLRIQLDTSNQKLRRLQEDNQRLAAGLAARESELAKIIHKDTGTIYIMMMILWCSIRL